MNYAPAVTPKSGDYIMQGLQMSQRNGEMMARLLGYFIERGNAKDSLRTQVETLAQPEGGGSAGAGFNPMAPGQEGAPMPGGEGESEGPSPAMQAGQRADAIRKLVAAYAPQAKDLHSGLKAMSLDQLEGMLKGYTLQQAAAEMQGRMAEHTARMDHYRAEADLRNQNVLDDQTVGQLLKAYGSYEPGEGQTAAPGERLRYALSQVPGDAGGRVLPKAMDSITRYEHMLNPKAGEDMTSGFEEDPVTGARFYHRGKTSMSSGFNPEVTKQQEPEAHFDDDGRLTGFSTWDSKKGWVFKAAKDTGLKRATLQDGSTVPGFVMTGDGKLHDVRSAMEKAMGASAGPTAEPMALPKKKEELQKGQRYQTAKGVATWDGTQFIPVK